MKSGLTRFLLFSILILAACIRLVHLGTLPNGLQQDETSLGYNAYSILKTGRDEYGKIYPLSFKAFGEYKLPGYIYLSTVPISILGTTATAVRLPAALLGILTVLLVYLLVNELTDGKKQSLALLSALFVALNPWHIHFSRGAFEVTPALFFLTLGVWSFLKATRTHTVWLYVLSLTAAIASMYTYNIARVVTPLLMAYVVWHQRKHIQLNRSSRIGLTLITVILLIPFFLTALSVGGFSSTTGTLLFTSPVNQAQLLEFRSYMITLPTVIHKLLFNAPLQSLWLYMEHIVSYLSVSFLFLSGSSHGNHSIGTTGQFYLFELVTMIVGALVLFRAHTPLRSAIVSWVIAVVLVAAATREAPQATRSFFLIVPLSILSAFGCAHVVHYLASYPSRLVRITLSVLFAGFMLYSVARFGFSYTQRFPVAYASAWRSADQQVSTFIQEHEADYERVIFDTDTGFMYTSYLYYSAFSPTEFYQTVKRAPDTKEGFSEVTSFGKFELKDVNEKDFLLPRTLIITTPQNKPEHVPPLAAFYYPKRPVVMVVDGEIVRFPVEDIAYVAVATVSQ
jgi:4-amino-4-deoxy-L-arabinose transferase-like glycosyltransferase